MDLSINLTIHNKGYLLPTTLSKIKELTIGIYEIVFVLDGCTDNSEYLVETFCKENTKIKTTVLFADNIFETKSNNLAAKASGGNHIIILQDDVILNEMGWNTRILKPFREYNDVFAVTSNTAHNWEINPNSEDIKTDIINDTKWCDILNHVHHANQMNIPRDIFAIRDCVNRAPLAIKHEDLVIMNYFDESFAPLDMDDHDLCYRMHKTLGKQVGCYWIDWYSKPQYGGTRDDNGNTKPWALAANNKNVRIVFERHKDYISTQKIQNRILK